MKRYIDRGAPVVGIDRTFANIRQNLDAGISPRDIQNFSLFNGRPRRRKGYKALNSPVRDQVLCKATRAALGKKFEEDDTFKHTIFQTPLSYGRLKWNDDYQIKTTSPYTIDFMLMMGEKERLVVTPFSRRARRHTGAPDWAAGTHGGVLREPGVYVLDQMLLSNDHKFNDGTIASPGNDFDLSTLLANWQFDVFPLITMAFGYTETSIFCEMGLVEKSGVNVGRYWPREILLKYTLPSAYTVGDIHHIALSYDPNLGTNGRLTFFVDGVSRATYDIPGSQYGFIGEFDTVNGIVKNTGIHRDIVLLNEATVRASYSSACMIRQDMHGHQTFYQDYLNSPNEDSVPWCLSPPRGTALWDLRIWSEAKDATAISSIMAKRILPSDPGLTNLKGNWYLNDGGPVCQNSQGDANRFITLHHGYPGYVEVDKLLHGLGISLADNQFASISFDKNDRFIGDGLHSKLAGVFDVDLRGDPAGEAFLRYQDKHSFTVQMQVLVPIGFQDELNESTVSPTVSDDVNLTNTRRAMNLPAYVLQDGKKDNVAAARRTPIAHATSIPVNYVNQYARAYDQTLWSIEGTQQFDSPKRNNEADRRRIPLARGVIDPDGHVCFELYKRQGNSQPGLLYRLRATAALTPGDIYTISFVVSPEWSFVADKVDCIGWKMEIFYKNITTGAAQVSVGSYTENRTDGTVVGAETLSPRSSPIEHETNYDINIGASYINDGWDWSIQAPFVATTGATSEPDRGDFGPWPVQQRFMSPYQDQPGNFVLGFFRLWSVALTSDELDTLASSSLSTRDYSADLLFNVEIDQITGNRLKSSCRYPRILNTGYKSWGMPQGFRDKRFEPVTGLFLKNEYLRGAWSFEDGPGYLHLVDTASMPYNSRQVNADVTAIAEYRSTLAQSFGLLYGFKDSFGLDNDINGNISRLFIQGHGVASEFSQNRKWSSVAVGDRTILAHQGALPKVYSGRTMTVAGFKRWTGGVPQVYASATTGSLASGKWYGVVVVYESEEWGIQHISPVVTVFLQSGATPDTSIEIYNVAPHYDPRVSSIKVYRTLAQVSEELAKAAPLFLSETTEGSANAFYDSIRLIDGDADLTPAALNRNVTDIPPVAFVAELNGKVYYGGDPLIPDIVYHSDFGNPERVDTVVNRLVLEKNAGSILTGLVSVFGAIYAFKPDKTFRIVQLAGDAHQVDELWNVGAVNFQSIKVVTDPESGRSLLFFWSQHGPYLFDGVTLQYIGSRIEEPPSDNIPISEIEWLSNREIVVLDDIRNRELICFYRPKIVDPNTPLSYLVLDRPGEAMVFNYRFKSWSRYTGMTASVAHSFTRTLDAREAGATLKPSNINTVASYHPIFGYNGTIFQYGESLNDGLPAATSDVSGNPHLVVAYENSTHTLTVDTVAFDGVDMSGVWVTIYSAITGDWVIAPVVSNSTGGIFVLEADWVDRFNMSIQKDDIVYFSQAPAYIEYPWDEMNIGQQFAAPFLDKQILFLVTWLKKAFKCRLSLNYDEAAYIPDNASGKWKDIEDTNGQRKRIGVNINAEAVRLELMSRELSSEILAYGYQAHHKKEGIVGQ